MADVDAVDFVDECHHIRLRGIRSRRPASTRQPTVNSQQPPGTRHQQGSASHLKLMPNRISLSRVYVFCSPTRRLETVDWRLATGKCGLPAEDLKAGSWRLELRSDLCIKFMYLHIATLNVLRPPLTEFSAGNRVRKLMFNEFNFFMRYLLDPRPKAFRIKNNLLSLRRRQLWPADSRLSFFLRLADQHMSSLNMIWQPGSL